MRFIRLFFGLLLFVGIVIFSVANRSVVSLDLWPLPVQLEIPLYIVGLGGFFLSLMICISTLGVAAWWWRGRAKSALKRIEALEETLKKARSDADKVKDTAPLAALPSPDQ